MSWNWGALMRAGITGLGLKPAEFWALTPAELRLMLGEPAAPLGADRLKDLMAAWPDVGGNDDRRG